MAFPGPYGAPYDQGPAGGYYEPQPHGPLQGRRSGSAQGFGPPHDMPEPPYPMPPPYAAQDLVPPSSAQGYGAQGYGAPQYQYQQPPSYPYGAPAMPSPPQPASDPLPYAAMPPPPQAIPPAHRAAHPMLPKHPSGGPQAYPPPSAYPQQQPAYPYPPPSQPVPPSYSGSHVHMPAAAGGYRRDNIDAPRPGIGRGVYGNNADSMSSVLSDGSDGHLQCSSDGRSESVPPGPRVRGPEGFAARQHNADSLEQWAGGLMGKEQARSLYGAAHAGKNVHSSLAFRDNGLEPSDSNAQMHGMKHFSPSGKLQIRPEMGFMPGVPAGAADAPEQAKGLRAREYQEQESRKDHMQNDAGGLTADVVVPVGRRRVPHRAAMSNISAGPAGMSTSIEGDKFVGLRHGGPHIHHVSHIVQSDGGITEGGDAPLRRRPHAGKTSESHFSNGGFEHKPEVGPDGLPLPIRPRAFAGRAGASSISYEHGTLTVTEADAKPRVRGDPSRWGTTAEEYGR